MKKGAGRGEGVGEVMNEESGGDGVVIIVEISRQARDDMSIGEMERLGCKTQHPASRTWHLTNNR